MAVWISSLTARAGPLDCSGADMAQNGSINNDTDTFEGIGFS
jgi:hypothetical protein